MAFTSKDDINILQPSDSAVVGAGSGNDVYVLALDRLSAGQQVQISDTQGNNSLQLIGGLTISSSIVAANAAQLTLSNGAVVTVLGADNFSYEIGGNPLTKTAGVVQNYATFATSTLGASSVPGSGTVQGAKNVTVSSTGAGAGTGTGTGTGTGASFHTSVTGVDSTSLLTTQSSIVKALNGDDKWASTALTYSFDTTRPSDYTGVSVDSTTSGNLTTGWQPLSATLSTLASEIISSIDKLVPLSFTQVSANGDIRFSQVPTTNSVAAFAYYPGTTPSYSGDVFIDTGIDNTTLGAGGYGQLTITHELGHALGLKHPFENGVTLPAADDNHANTLMSYTDYQSLVPVFTTSGNSINFDSKQIYPDRFMVYDIAALQAIYGPDTGTQTGNTTYQYGTSPFYASLWDAGGVDTLDLSATTASNTVDLIPGHYSSINTRSVSTQAQEQKQITPGFDKFIDGVYSQQSSSIYTGTKNLGIAYGAIIENLVGGSAADTVYDNKVDNDIKTGAGNDTIVLGAGGYDTIDGGTGTDTISLALTKSQVTYEAGSNGLIRLVGTTFAADLYNIEKLAFTDQTVTLA